MIRAKGIRKNFGKIEVLKGIDIDIKPSTIVSIVGSSGAGKTTLLHILSTLDLPDQGTVVLNNTSVQGLSKNELAHFRNTQIGFIFQFHHLLPEFTALENICIPAFIKGTSKKEAEHKAMEILSFLKLAQRATHKPNQLSGGEQQRIAVARALINQPAVIFADEPSGNLDSKNAEELHQLFFDLRDAFGQTFVIVTHNEKLALMSDQKMMMQDGLLVAHE